jgi:hypothetical protein
MIFRRAAPAPSELPAPMTEAEVLLEHANIMRKLASDMASQHLTLMLVGDGSPTNNLVRDTVGANRRSMEEAADHLQRLAGEARFRPPGLTLWQFVFRVGLSFAVGITLAPFMLMAVFWAVDEGMPPQRGVPPIAERQRASASSTPQAEWKSASDNRGEKNHGAR